jgi:hypothetical protein
VAGFVLPEMIIFSDSHETSALIMNKQEISTSFSLPIEIGSINRMEPFVRHWCKESNVNDEAQFRLVYAVNEMTEGIIRLGTDLLVTGNIEIVIVPWSGSVEISITFPQEIPLDPSFNHNDGLLEQFPGMTISPDIFWHHIILNWIDKASWKRKGKKITITLTQFARDPNRAGELYFLSIRPKLPESLQISYGKNNYVIVQYKDHESAVRLNEKSAFVLKAVDGHTSVRDIYYGFINEFGMVHPLSFGKIVEDLIERRLILTGEPLISKKSGWLRTTTHKFLKLRYSFPGPDKILTGINRFAGWIWSRQAFILYVIFLIICSLVFIMNYRDLSSGFNSVVKNGLHLPVIYFFVFYSFYSIGIVLHELAHGVVCKRFGGTVHEMGLLVYFGHICAYVDTTDTWMFPEKLHRIGVSFAGPLATLIWTYIEGLLCLLFLHNPELSVIFGSLFALGIFSFFINLIPWGETDGYFIVTDLFSIPNLRMRAFSFLTNRMKNLFVKTAPPEIQFREKVIYMTYIIMTPGIIIFGLLLPAIILLRDKLGNMPLSLTIILVLVFLAVFFERVIRNAFRLYSKSQVTTLNLKKN